MSTQTPIHAACVPLGIGLGLLLLTSLAQWQRDFVASELGLGLQTYSFETERDGVLVSGDLDAIPALAARLQVLRRAGRTSVLWLGASQLHAINQPGPEAKLAIWYAQERARRRGAPVAYSQLSLPNAGPVELLAVYQAFRAKALRPDRLVLAFTYDDLNETELRQDVSALLDRVRPQLVAADASDSMLARARERAQRAREGPAAAPVTRSATAGTPQEQLELALVSALESIWPAYAARHTVRSAGIAAWKLPFTGLLFRLRGRPIQLVDPEAQQTSEAALLELIAQTRADGVALLIYQAPHRPDAQHFYHDRRAYDAYHERLAGLSTRNGVAWLDLETLVPAPVYGLTDQYLPDVFHFREEGHHLLGEAIDAWHESQGQ